MSGVFRPTSRLLLQSSRRMLSGNTAGPTPSKFRTAFSQLPIEVYPLIFIVSFMSSFGIYSMGKALWGGTGRGEFRRHKAKPHELNVWER